jgi:hypothetical protein
MFTRTSWRINRWNSETVSFTLGVGLGGGTVEIGLVNGSESHTIAAAGGSVSVGAGLSLWNVGLPGGLMGLASQNRTQGGTLYKNDALVPGELTLQWLLFSQVVNVHGFELAIADEGQSAYMVTFGGAGPTPLVPLTCMAVTFLSTGNAGLPNISANQYLYRIIGEV